MRKRISILFLFIFLVSATEFGQILRVPILIGHYVEHKTMDQGLDFLNFLQLHYNQSLQEQNDPLHDKLPFLSQISVVSFTAIVMPYNLFKVQNIGLLPVQKKNIYHYVPNIESSYLSTIWQPPKLV